MIRFDSMLVKPKCVWEAFIWFENCKQRAEKFKINARFSNTFWLYQHVDRFWVISSWKVKNGSGTPCTCLLEICFKKKIICNFWKCQYSNTYFNFKNWNANLIRFKFDPALFVYELDVFMYFNNKALTRIIHYVTKASMGSSLSFSVWNHLNGVA